MNQWSIQNDRTQIRGEHGILMTTGDVKLISALFKKIIKKRENVEKFSHMHLYTHSRGGKLREKREFNSHICVYCLKFS